MPEPVGCPSCGHMIDDADGVCAVCGFTVRAERRHGGRRCRRRRGRPGRPVRRPEEGAAGWAPQAPSRPPRISAPAPVAPPPSQISVDGLGLRWSSRLPRRPVRAAAAAAAAVAVAGGASVSAGGLDVAPACLAAGRSAPAATQGAARRSPGAVAHAAARARERQRELTRSGRPGERPCQVRSGPGLRLSRGFGDLGCGVGRRSAGRHVTTTPGVPLGPVWRPPRPSPSPRGGAGRARRSRPRRWPARRRRAAARPCRGSAS